MTRARTSLIRAHRRPRRRRRRRRCCCRYDADRSGFVDSREIVEMMDALLPQSAATSSGTHQDGTTRGAKGNSDAKEGDDTIDLRKKEIEKTLATFGFEAGEANEAS